MRILLRVADHDLSQHVLSDFGMGLCGSMGLPGRILPAPIPPCLCMPGPISPAGIGMSQHESSEPGAWSGGMFVPWDAKAGVGPRGSIPDDPAQAPAKKIATAIPVKAKVPATLRLREISIRHSFRWW
ncbi:hypothetical protein A5710_22445 [Mycolicibacter sinensis]|uniref:Uncharacterized protein n=1 Tax=Mycolicibacter sinensis (strain JDM601) TaxID=875328 RepID=A0A1A2XTW2_MYCSD|nr:hypothetical protein A5694_19635 [Mycolicibacter sinensis]OBI29185.1 hypothetical protein A5710_22445 [Mycolicibacter sinensis]